MPAFPDTELPHVALVWLAIPGKFGSNGEPLVSRAYEPINCWVKSEGGSNPATHGESRTDEPMASLDLIVDRKIPESSRIWIGTKENWNKGVREGFIYVVNNYSQQFDNLTGEIVLRTAKAEKLQEASTYGI